MIEGRFAAKMIQKKIDSSSQGVVKQERDWPLLGIALGTKDGIITLKQNGVFIPFVLGMLKNHVRDRSNV